MQRQRYRGVESNLFHQFLPPSDFYINVLMPKLFKHVNCPTIFFSAFDKPCIPLKTSMKSLFMSRNGHDKNMTKMYRNGLMF